MRVELGFRTVDDAASRRVQRSLAWEVPRLPSASATNVPRWSATPTWTPPGSILIVRHRSLDGRRRIVTNDRHSPPGFEIEFDLGLVHATAQPGTGRLVRSEDGFFCTPFEGVLADGFDALGYVEQAPLPLLDALEQRRDPASGQIVLVAGSADPLYETAAPLGCLGFVEGYPINPRTADDVRVDRRLVTLVRQADDAAWRHRYATSETPGEADVALGGILVRPRPGSIELRSEADGTLVSELLSGGRPGTAPAPKAAARWLAAPLTWDGARPHVWAVRASASRTRQLTRSIASGLPTRIRHASPRPGSEQPLGHMLREPAPRWSPLFSARHPVLGDQYLTRSEIEARDMGYEIEGVIGYVADWRADPGPGAPEVKWASRFGQRRRYVEGPVGS